MTAALRAVRCEVRELGRKRGVALHDIWGMSSPTVMAFLSLAVVAVYAVLFTVVAVTVFRRATVR